MHAYKMEILKLKKVVEDREDKRQMQEMKKHQSRLHTHTATNFYNPFINPKDSFFPKTVNQFHLKSQTYDQDDS